MPADKELPEVSAVPAVQVVVVVVVVAAVVLPIERRIADILGCRLRHLHRIMDKKP